jgi:recombinational DNA repair protein (RecF pathway)
MKSESQGGVAYRGERSVLVGPYHICARCGSRVHISDLDWQFGLLICHKWDCYDTGNNGLPLIGQREQAVSNALEIVQVAPDLMPDPKLTDPDASGQSYELDIIY